MTDYNPNLPLPAMRLWGAYLEQCTWGACGWTGTLNQIVWYGGKMAACPQCLSELRQVPIFP